MARAIKRSAETWTYVLLADRELRLEEQTRFTLRPLTLIERQRVEDEISRSVTRPDGSREIVSRTNQIAVELAVRHIDSIENFPAGYPKPWPTEKNVRERERYLEQLDDLQVIEIGNEIWERSTILPPKVAGAIAPVGADARLPDDTIKNS